MKPILGKILLDKRLTLFLSTYQRQNFYIEDFVYILVFCEAQVSDRAWVLKYQLECDKVQWLQHIVGQREFLWANHYTKIFCFCVHSGAPDLIYPETSLYEQILWIHLEKNRTYARTFPVQRKEINAFVKVRFTMTYSLRKLNNKVITTACNFWRQIACSF